MDSSSDKQLVCSRQILQEDLPWVLPPGLLTLPASGNNFQEFYMTSFTFKTAMSQ
jgi:hypothetical protein